MEGGMYMRNTWTISKCKGNALYVQTEYLQSYLCEADFCCGFPSRGPRGCSLCLWSWAHTALRHWSNNYCWHSGCLPWFKNGWAIMHWKPRTTIYVILRQCRNWAQVGILRNLHKRNLKMLWNMLKVHTRYYIYCNVPISVQLLIYIYAQKNCKGVTM